MFGLLICRVKQKMPVSPLKPSWYQLGANLTLEPLNALGIVHSFQKRPEATNNFGPNSSLKFLK